MPAMMAIFCVFLAGCTLRLFSPVQSEWKALDDAESVSCDRWPVQVTDLSPVDVRVIHSPDRHGFYMKTTTRKGARQFYRGMFPESYTVSQEHLIPFEAAPGSTWAGGGGGVWATIAEAGEGEGVAEGTLTLSLRSLKGTHIRPLRMSPSVDKVYLAGTAEGLWMTSQGEQGYSLSFIQTPPDLSGAPSIQNIPGVFQEKPLAFGNPGQNKGWMLVPVESEVVQAAAPAGSEGDEGHSAGGPSISFEWKQVLAGGKAGRAIKVPLPDNQGIEGWALQPVAGGFALAYVEGDSLVGDSRLEIAWVDTRQNRPVVKWRKTFEMENIHVGEPAWAVGKNSLRLFLLQWVDAEATLASWKVSEAGANQVPLRGVFPKGSTLMDTLVDRESSVAYALVRFREDLNWQFDLCELR